MARPKKPAPQKRVRHVMLRLTVDEFAALTGEARRSGRPRRRPCPGSALQALRRAARELLVDEAQSADTWR